METQKFDFFFFFFFFFFLKFKIVEIEFCLYPEKRNHPGFVDIDPTLVIATSMEKSSRVLSHGAQKIELLCSKLNFDLCHKELKSH